MLLWVHLTLFQSRPIRLLPNPSGCSESDAIYVFGKYVINVTYVLAA